MLRSVVFRQRRFITIGIRREEKNRWETRVPIIPEDAKVLSKLPNVNIIVQPCTKRIFTDKEYLEVYKRVSTIVISGVVWSDGEGGLEQV